MKSVAANKATTIPYCQDNAISWFDWELVYRKTVIYCRFFQLLIRFRKRHALLQSRVVMRMPHITWHGTELNAPDWSHESRSLAMHLAPVDTGEPHLYLIAHAHWQARCFHLPALPHAAAWRRVVDTSRISPGDILS